MSGVLGRLFREFAVTITTAVLISGLVSVTLTPMLCSRFLNVAALHAKGRFARVMEAIFQRLFRTYEWSPRARPPPRAAMLAVFAVVLLSTARMYVVIPKGFIPDQDNDSLNVNVQAAQGRRTTRWCQYVGRIADVINRNPSVDTFFASTGGGFGSMNTARLNIQLVPRGAPGASPPPRSRSSSGRSSCPFRASGLSSACRPRCRLAVAWATAPTTSRSRARTPPNCTTGRRGWRRPSRRCPSCRTCPTTCR
jgi:multidrug efflux pump subunit AcrB